MAILQLQLEISNIQRKDKTNKQLNAYEKIGQTDRRTERAEDREKNRHIDRQLDRQTKN